MNDVAKHAGVSIWTVSSVIHNKAKVRAETKEKVLKSIQELDYIPNEAAQNLRNKTRSVTGKKLTYNVGCIVSTIFNKYSSVFNAEILDGMDEELTKNKYKLSFVYRCAELVNNYAMLNEMINESKIDGLILLGTTLEGIKDQIKQRIHNIVSVKFSISSDIDSILLDQSQAAYDAIKYLIELGHKRIAFVGDLEYVPIPGPSGYNAMMDEKLVVYKQALKDFNLEYDESIVEKTLVDKEYDHVRNGYTLTKKILERANPAFAPTAIFSAADTMTIGVLNAIREKGFKIPDDISLMGCGDDIETLRYLDPPLTTMTINRKEIGSLAVKRIMERTKNTSVSPMKMTMPFSLAIRGSCKKIEVK